MAESQATQPATPVQAPSPPASQELPPSEPSLLQRGDRDSFGRENQESVSKRNPFSPENMAKRREALNSLRQDRGVPPPQAKEPQHDAQRETPRNGDAANGATESNRESRDSVPHSPVAQPPQPKTEASPPVSDAQMQWYQREQAVQAAEAKAKEAGNATEKRIAAAEKKEAEAQAALQKLDWARSNPIEFMTEAGMTQDEWKAFLQNGGTLSPEQKRTRALEKELAETRAQMTQFMKEQEQHRLRSAHDMEAAQFVGVMSNYELVTRMGGIEAVQNKRTFLEQQGGQKVSLKDAADALEQEYHHGLSALLKDKAVRTKFGLDVNTSDAGPVASRTPRTLNQKVAPTTPPATPARQKGPPDWAACRAEYLRRIESERASSAR